MFFCFLKQKTAYEMRISDWSSDVCSSDLINPGNVGFGRKRDTQFAQLIEFAIQYGKPVRIGANWGSLDQSLATRLMDENARRAEPWDAGRVLREALILSALESAQRAVEIGLPAERIILSATVSGVQELNAVYRDLRSEELTYE